jgi:hypothetical protein
MKLTPIVLTLAALGPGAFAVATAAITTPAVAAVHAGTYRVVLQSPGGELPFRLDLTQAGAGWAGFLVNGKERVKLDEVTVQGGHIDIKMPGYENRLSADAAGNGLHGELVLDKLGGKDQHIPLEAKLGQTYRFFPPEDVPARASAASVAGRWAVTFTDDEGATDHAGPRSCLSDADLHRPQRPRAQDSHRILRPRDGHSLHAIRRGVQDDPRSTPGGNLSDGRLICLHSTSSRKSTPTS